MREGKAEALLERYLAVLSVERNLSSFTLRNYAADLRHLFGWLNEEGCEPLAITRLVFRSYISAMKEAGVAQGSIVRRVSTARSFYRWLRLVGEMEADPLANVGLPKQPKRLPRALSIEDMTDLIAAADGDSPQGLRDRALLEVLYGAGLRVSEAASLDVTHVDLDEMTLLVRGKGNKERLTVAGGPGRAALERYLDRGRPALIRKNPRPASEPALFLNRDGTRMSQRRMQLIVRKFARKAGLDVRVHPHLFRHTFATHLLDGGAELRVVQELMGHASPNTTQIYLHVTEERQRAEMERSRDGLAEIESARRASRNARRTVVTPQD
jgi:site-specific recombinase XerD